MFLRSATLGTFVLLLASLGAAPTGVADDTPRAALLAQAIRRLDPNVLLNQADGPGRERLRRMVAEDIRRRRDEFNRRDLQAWQSIRNREDWESFKAARIAALRRSLGQVPDPARNAPVTKTKEISGEGFVIQCLVFESRPGLLITANLYRPAALPHSGGKGDSPISVGTKTGTAPGQRMPGILICHSHHNPKTQGELQDMGMTWARHGCLVLVMDQLGHGERRQHPFRTAEDYTKKFPVGRQDYHFRYNVGIQLHLVGESLVGWMAGDLMRGVDVLLGQPGVDPDRIILLGSVAGGGDPAAVAAALDPRVKAAVPFNFGGPQPETVYPLPEDAQRRFNYLGGGSWESTRNLRASAPGGFFPWVIVGAIAPRALIYAHEFSWDQQRDPVWKRLEAIYTFYGVPERLSSVHGWGGVQLSSAQASHCNNIGPAHRKQIYPALERWFGMAPPEEYQARRDPAELACLEGVDAARRSGKEASPLVVDAKIDPVPVHRLADRIAAERLTVFRAELARLDPAGRRAALRRAWSAVLGDVEPAIVFQESNVVRPTNGRPEYMSFRFAPPDIINVNTNNFRAPEPTGSNEGGFRALRVALSHEQDLVVPVVLLLPESSAGRPSPCVIGVAQAGKEGFLKNRAEDIALLLARGIAVCLPDLRGTGETGFGTDRGRRSEATALSSSELMLGNTFVGLRLKDLRSVLRWLRTSRAVDARRIAVWGDSFTPPNAPDRRIDVPLGIGEEPPPAEPLGPLLALLAGLFDEDLVAVAAQGGLTGFRSVLQCRFVYIPHDVVVPGALAAGDFADVGAALAPRPLLMRRCVDGTNRALPAQALRDAWATVRSAYQTAGAAEDLALGDGPGSVADWLAGRLAPIPSPVKEKK